MNKTYALTYTLLIFISVALFTGSATITMAENVMISSDIRGFSKVWLSSSSDVKISTGQNFSVVMTGDEEKIANTTLVRQRDILIIKSKNKNHNYDHDQLMLVTIVMPNIEEMKINGSGNVHITGIDSEELDLAINGSGDISVQGQSEGVDFAINGSGDILMDKINGKNVELSIHGSGNVTFGSGTCQSFKISIYGSGDVDADKVQCNDVDVDILGSGDSSVYASNSINFDSPGSGRVDVFGKPKSVYDKKAKRKSSLIIH
ncbi:DUF2807 domain-containing protein [Alphaproteobacteria bacterium]|nr:DUF2807 domain-containing protein [Alphaproteobacteria bacterium]